MENRGEKCAVREAQKKSLTRKIERKTVTEKTGRLGGSNWDEYRKLLSTLVVIVHVVKSLSGKDQERRHKAVFAKRDQE